MANRTGIELLPSVCRIVEVQAGGGLFGGRKGRGHAKVRSFHEIPYSPNSSGLLAAELRQIKGLERRAWVAVWGLRSRHEAYRLPPAATGDLEAMARQEARATAGAGASDQVADGISVGELREGGRREVGYVSVPPEEMRSRLQPLVDAGFIIERAVTPAVAHGSLVQQRWASFPDAVTAVLSVNARATALTILRGSIVLFARELPWGYETERAEQAGGGIDPNRFAANLASELRRSFVYLKQHHKADVTHVLVCGDVPDMRSLTGPLMHELSIEVETLDALEGLDLSRLPESADQFRSRLAALRTAWALAADTATRINLVPRGVKAVAFTPKIERRHGVAAVAGVLIAVAAWGLVTWFANGASTEQVRLRRQIALLEPEMQRLGEARRDADLASARLTALRAFASQGPRLAKVLEVFSRATPPDIALTEFTLEPAVGSWTLSVTGKAEGSHVAQAQITFGRFLTALKASPLLGDPLTSPAISVKNQDPVPEKPRVVVEARPPELLVPQLMEPTRRSGYAGPAYIEVARNGRVYRIPTRQAFSANAYRDDELERERQRRALTSGVERLTLAAQPPAEPTEPPARRAGAVLEFTIQYEVRK